MMSTPQGTKVIMVVDDSAIMREMLKRVVDPYAKEYYEFSNGSDAVSAFDSIRPDVTLMDIKMDIMDGIVATRKITEKHPEANIIIVTDYGDRAFVEAAKNAGASGYVLKENLFDLRTILQ